MSCCVFQDVLPQYSLPEPIIELKSDRLQLFSLRMKPNNAGTFIFVCSYRALTSVVDGPALENLREILGKLDKEENKIILVGDTNRDIMDIYSILNIEWNS